jgi:hypothetical protein
MTERPKSGRIQKTTSRIALIGLAAATMIVTVSIVGAMQLQEASAARPQFCPNIVAPIPPPCFDTMKECREALSSVPGATRCSPQVAR